LAYEPELGVHLRMTLPSLSEMQMYLQSSRS
jgi:hypothetical protein